MRWENVQQQQEPLGSDKRMPATDALWCCAGQRNAVEADPLYGEITTAG
jgi:hypothetical protein